MIDLEGIAHRITVALYADAGLDEVELAKIEYGLSLSLGIAITLAATLGLAALLGLFAPALALALAALSLRLFTGGTHCSSYDRCLILSVSLFVLGAALARWAAAVLPLGGALGVYLGVTAATALYLLTKRPRLALMVVAVTFAVLGFSLAGAESSIKPAALAVSFGFALQTALTTGPGRRLVDMADAGLKKVVK
ncbi:MAG: hypothetical protein GX090_04870 [Firmicutes bacterium]|nr:hypothetical protein [Bacillota bacterium]HPZ91346.1 accessory gene regulator B family protein [Bacillota bacterium]HQE02686.1 accessory gene regulator B family protein [Bacillota bacterium]